MSDDNATERPDNVSISGKGKDGHCHGQIDGGEADAKEKRDGSGAIVLCPEVDDDHAEALPEGGHAKVNVDGLHE